MQSRRPENGRPCEVTVLDDARAQHRRRLEDKCAYLYNTQRHTRAAHRAIDALKHSPDRPAIATLRHPDTGADCVDPAAKADALRAKYAAMAEAQPAAHATEQRERATARAKVEHARATRAPASDEMNERFDATEVAAGISRMANHKAPGDDNMPAELLKYSGPAGVAVVTKLFNRLWIAEKTPTKWRQGIIVSIYKADDPTDCSNYRPLTLLPVLDKLYATLLTRRMERIVPLHDHQYAFRKSRGTLNALFNLTAALRKRTRAGMPTFATFFDAAKAYDTVPRELMLARLLDKGVAGRLFSAVDSLYARAASALSSFFPVQRGVAQGCPMSPFLYALFIDSLLDDLLALGATEGLEVGAGDWHRLLTGQAYADDLSGFADTPEGMQRVIDVVRAHSLRWGWSVNVRKTAVVIFGHETIRAQYAACDFWWGTDRLQLHQSAKYLGLHLRADTTWQDQHAAAVQKGRGAAAMYAPLLASNRLPVRLKLLLLSTRIEPTMTYALEVWTPPTGRSARSGAVEDPMDTVLRGARRLAVGIHASKHEKAWERSASIKPAILDADCQALSADDMCTMAHVRYYEAARKADEKAARSRNGDPLHPSFTGALPVSGAADYMGAAARSTLQDNDTWRTRAARGRALTLSSLKECDRARYTVRPDPDAAPRIPNHNIRSALLADAARRRAAQARATPAGATCTRSGRQIVDPNPPPEHLNPVAAMLVPGAAPPPYIAAPKAAVYPIMCLRSGHLPCDSGPAFRSQYESSYCRHCDDQVLPDEERARLTDDEMRWRHVQHLLTRCTDQCGGNAPRPLLQDLREDLLDASAGYPDALDAVRAAFDADMADLAAARSTCVEYLLDPIAACPGPPTVALTHANLTAAYITLVAASVPYPDVDGPMGRAQCLTMPPGSRLHKLARAADDEPDTPCSRQSHQAASRASSESLDEAWLRDDTPPPAYIRNVMSYSVCPSRGAHAEANAGPFPSREVRVSYSEHSCPPCVHASARCACNIALSNST